MADAIQPITENYLRTANRAQLTTYLEAWGYQCYDSEDTDVLRLVALMNFDTESAQVMQLAEHLGA